MPFHPPRLRRLSALAAAAAITVSGFALVAAPAGAADAPEDTTPPAACTIQPAGNARYVAWVYQEILGRCPDDSGLAYWTAALDQGKPRMNFVLAVDNSDENIMGNNVMALFQGVLHRAPTADEAAYWANKIRTERADGELFATLYSSDDFYNSPAVGGTTDGFIAFLYAAVLDRVGDQSVADPQGWSFYESVLGDHPTEAQRFHVAFKYFENSTENARDWVWASYQEGLGRLPDAVGGMFWTDWVVDSGYRTFDMCNALQASQEAWDNAQVNQNPPPSQH